jgi:hypothetical protein
MKSLFTKLVTLSFLVIAIHSFAQDKILIITHAFNRPDFIELQAKTFKAFLEDDYEFVVFNDARDEKIRKEIKTVCHNLNLPCREIPSTIHHNRERPSERTSDSIQYSLEVLGFEHDGIVFVIDSDMFLLKSFSISRFLKGCDLYGCIQYRPQNVTYIWNGLVFMDMRTMPNRKTINFDCGKVNGEPVDSGGQIHHYLKNNPSLQWKHYSNTHIDTLPRDRNALHSLGYNDLFADFILSLNPHDPYPMEFHVEDYFLHYRAGGNWTHESIAYHNARTMHLRNFINALIKNSH